MNKQIINTDNIKRFTDQCLDRDNDKAARDIKEILSNKSPRMPDIYGNPDANYKTIQRFLDKVGLFSIYFIERKLFILLTNS